MGGRPGTRSASDPGGVPVKLRVDHDRCEGHGRCFALAPDLFDIDDYGVSTPTNDGLVPPAAEANARLAVANCPEYAITLEDLSNRHVN